MPKAILEFNLPEENAEHELAINGGTYRRILDEVLASLRTDIKYRSEELPEEAMEYAIKMREFIFDLADEYKIEL